MTSSLTPETLLPKIPYFAPLSTPAKQDILDTWQYREVSAAEIIFLEGYPTAGWFAIADGRVQISKVSSEGKEQGLHLQGAGDTFNEISALDGGDNPASAVALEPTILYHLPRPLLLDLMTRHTELAQVLVAFLAKRIRTLVHRVETISFDTLDKRLARFLLEHAMPDPDTDTLLVPRQRWLTQQLLAVQLGTAREVVGRLLRQFEKEGLIVFDRRQIRLLDVDRLRALGMG